MTKSAKSTSGTIRTTLDEFQITLYDLVEAIPTDADMEPYSCEIEEGMGQTQRIN